MVENGPLPFEDAIDVVVLQAADGQVVPVAGSIPIDLEDGAEPVGVLLTELLTATVRVRADDGIAPATLAALGKMPVPSAFRASPWLDASRAIVVRDGVGRVGELTVYYSSYRGLRIDVPEAALSSNSDDLDDEGDG